LPGPGAGAVLADGVADNASTAKRCRGIGLGRSERDAVVPNGRSSSTLKLAFARQPRFDWMASIVEARSTLGDKISPTLRQDTETMLVTLYREGRRRAELALRGYGEDLSADALPQQCPYSLDDIFREDWFPEPPGEQP
jgi:hypothetical protein